MAYAILSESELVGGKVEAANKIIATSAERADKIQSRAAGYRLDRIPEISVESVEALGDGEFGVRLSLAANTPQTPNLTNLASLTGGVGNTNFTGIHQITIIPRGTNAQSLTIGNAASAQFDHFVGSATGVVVIPGDHPGFVFRNTTTNGATTTSKTNLKLDPGANALTVDLVIRGKKA